MSCKYGYELETLFQAQARIVLLNRGLLASHRDINGKLRLLLVTLLRSLGGELSRSPDDMEPEVE